MVMVMMVMVMVMVMMRMMMMMVMAQGFHTPGRQLFTRKNTPQPTVQAINGC